MTDVYIHINIPTPWAQERRVKECPWERHRRRFIVRDFGYYGVVLTCCGCGNEWDSEAGRRKVKPAEMEARREWARDQWKQPPFDNRAWWLGTEDAA